MRVHYIFDGVRLQLFQLHISYICPPDFIIDLSIQSYPLIFHVRAGNPPSLETLFLEEDTGVHFERQKYCMCTKGQKTT